MLLFFILTIWSALVLAFLYSTNLDKQYRYRQDITAIVAPFYALLCFYVLHHSFFEDAKNWLGAEFRKAITLPTTAFSTVESSLAIYGFYLLAVLCFCFIKWGLHRLRKQGKISDDVAFIAHYFYKKTPKSANIPFYLKSKFHYPRQYLAVSILLFSGLLCCSFLTIFWDKAMPSYIVLILFFLLEFFYFLDGVEGEELNKEPSSKKSDEAQYMKLWKNYQALWKANVLQAFIYKSDQKKIKESYDVNKELLVVNYKQSPIFDAIFKKIDELLKKGKTILLFMPDQFQPGMDVKESEQFKIIKKLLLNEEYIAQFYTHKLDELKRDKRIYITSIDQFLAMKLNIRRDRNLYDWFENLGMAIYFGYDKSLIESPESTVSVSSILKYLCKESDKLMTIVFAEDKQNAQEAFTSNIKVNTQNSSNHNAGFKEIRIQDHQARLSLFLNWKKEEIFENGVFESHFNKKIGAIAALMPLPYTYGIKSIYIKASNRAYLENYENLKKSKDTWLSIYDDLKVSNNANIDKYVHHLEHNLSLDQDDQKVVFVDDHLNNAPLLFKYFNGFAKKIAFVQIFSAPHILRKYFNDHFEFFVNSPIKPLSYLLLKEDRTTLALSLLEKLSKCRLTLDELYNDFNETNASRRIVLSQIKDLFKDIFQFDIIQSAYLEIEKNEKGEFVFSLKPDIKDHIELFKSVDFIDENNQLIFRKNKHLLFQKYSEGQFHAFNGRMYEINRIFDDGKGVIMKLNNKEPNKNYFFYTEKRIVKLEAINEGKRLKGNNTNTAEYLLNIYEASFEVYTNGYFEVDNNGFSLHNGDFTFRTINQVKRRFYRNGRVLKLQFKRGAKLPIAGLLTIRILLEEFSKILFPDSYQFLIFRTFSTETVKMKQVAHKAILNYYQLGNHDKSEEGYGLYIFEDSMFDMGHLRSIGDNIEYIFELMEDYLEYTIANIGKHTNHSKKIKESTATIQEEFLAFNLKNIKTLADFPDPIDLRIAKAIISSSLRNMNPKATKNQLTLSRMTFYK